MQSPDFSKPFLDNHILVHAAGKLKLRGDLDLTIWCFFFTGVFDTFFLIAAEVRLSTMLSNPLFLTFLVGDIFADVDEGNDNLREQSRVYRIDGADKLKSCSGFPSIYVSEMFRINEFQGFVFERDVQEKRFRRISVSEIYIYDMFSL